MEHTLSLRRALEVLKEKNLLAGDMDCPQQLTFTDITYDSRAAGVGSLFICKGLGFRPEFLESALKRGAPCYLSEKLYPVDAPAILVTDARKALAVLAVEYYGHPAEELKVIGLTGTKGKTTTTYFIKNILDEWLPYRSAVLSTVEMFTGGESTEAHLTTPESLELQQCFRDALDHGIGYLTMEVSSQAYKMQRVFGTRFEIGMFLNISEDHIGPLEHPDFEDYLQCKLRLLKHCRTAILYHGTDRFEDVFRTAKEHAQRVLIFGHPGDDAWVEYIKKENPGFSFDVCTPESRRRFRIRMEGRFNVTNALAAVTAARSLGVDDDSIARGIENVSVQGRMNLYEKDGKTVIVDYAHNFLSFTELFRSLREDFPGRPVKVLCGCPGHKNLQRRVDIGRLCGQNADYTYLTAEDPGFEDPAEICREMAGYIEEGGAPYTIIPDRTEAVKTAVEGMRPGDLLILAGKGEEDYQKVCGRYDFYESDIALAKRFLGIE